MGFWSDVRDLKKEIQKQVDAGAGNNAITLALQAQAQEQDKAKPAPPAAKAYSAPKKVSPAPQGFKPQEKMSTAEYRKLMRLD